MIPNYTYIYQILYNFFTVFRDFFELTRKNLTYDSQNTNMYT